jgi:hypothetical protein
VLRTKVRPTLNPSDLASYRCARSELTKEQFFDGSSIMLVQIISCGTNGAEQTALEVARAAVFLTGGQSWCGAVTPAVAGRLGLTIDPGCSARQARALNLLHASGTLVIGPVSQWRLTQLGPRVFQPDSSLENSGKRLADWCRLHRVKVLNVIGGHSAIDADQAGYLIWNLAERLGRSPKLPAVSGGGVQRRAKRVLRHRVVGGEKYLPITFQGRLFAVGLWPRPQAWRWDAQRGWVRYRRWQRLVQLKSACRCYRFGEDQQLAETTRRIGQLLPSVVRRAVMVHERIDAKLLALCSRFPKPSIDLARAKRHGMLRLLADADEVLKLDRFPERCCEKLPRVRLGRRVQRRLIRGRQRDALAAFGFPATESAVRAVAKLRAPVGLHSLLTLRPLLDQPATYGIVKLVPKLSDVALFAIQCRSIAHAASRSFWIELADFSNDCETLAELSVRLRRRAIPARSLRSWKHASKLLAMPEGDPPQPLRGCGGRIEQLCTSADLKTEGKEMNHCVASYADGVASGWSAVYRILPSIDEEIDRATVMLRVEGDRWVVDQLAGHSNTVVSPATVDRVNFWLATAQISQAEQAVIGGIIEHEIRCLAG